MKRFDKILADAARDAAKLEPWKVAFIQQCDNQYRTLAGKEPMPKQKKESRFARCRRVRRERIADKIEDIISALRDLKREIRG